MDSSSLLQMIGGGGAASGMPLEEKMEKAMKLKEKGNEQFRANEVKQALVSYNTALMYLHSTPDDKDAQREDVKKAKVLVELNLAACHLKLGDTHKAIVHCDKLLKLEPKNPKGLYRRAKAYSTQGSWAAAADDLAVSLEIDPANREVRRELAVCQRRADEMTAARKRKIAQGFFAAATDADDKQKKEEPAPQTEEKKEEPKTE
eukprot:TRINITY_DN6587_c0_g1_i1.p2 TRINITY_DN6587_c0_g1~~TRINITY_DN6587_c0_g1_i1.p2  ORF type:complete len:204 (-),score=83.56 TRINITY_DN6587_c0_g1_i1:30-641(-)